MDILVSVSGSTNGWLALDQAILVAQKESASLHGIHVMPPKADLKDPNALAVQEQFNKRCQEAGLQGTLNIERGTVSEVVSKRSLLADLLVLNVSHPPEPGLPSLGSGLRSIIWHSARPILTVPGKTSSMDRALLAFDGSAKSKEALFVATYVAEIWKTDLIVITLAGSENEAASVQDYARNYLELHEINADYIATKGSMDTMLDVCKERDINLMMMGGYSGTAFKEVIIGSMVNHLLREFTYPILICR